MHIKIKSLTLHNTFFIAGTNVGVKPDVTKKQGLEIIFDDENDRYVVTYKGYSKIIHTSNVADAEPINSADIGIKHSVTEAPPTAKVTTQGAPMKANISHTAQVETPHGLTRSKL